MPSRKQIAIPKMFFDDHYWRELPTPKIIGHKHGRYVVAADDPAIPELLNDAEHYAGDGVSADDINSGTGAWVFGHQLKRSARLTIQAIRSAQVHHD